MNSVFVQQLVPLYFFILVGFLVGRRLSGSRETISNVLIYILSPLVVFGSILKAPLNAETVSFPFIFWLTSSLVAFLFYRGVQFFKGPTHNLFAFGAGNANTGYFGIPATLALFGESHLHYAVLVALGFILYENTLGFFITARAHVTFKQACLKVLKLPAIYAVVLALIWRPLELFPETLSRISELARSSYSVLGFLIIGLNLSFLSFKNLDYKYLLSSQAVKFLVWPLVMLALIQLLTISQGVISNEALHVIKLMSIVPMAANTVVFASLLKVEPEKAALSVFISTIISFVLFSVVF